MARLSLVRRTFTIENAVSNGVWGLIYFAAWAGLAALVPVILHGVTRLSWPWLAIMGFGMFCLLSAATLAWWARQSVAAAPPSAAVAKPPLTRLSTDETAQLEAQAMEEQAAQSEPIDALGLAGTLVKATGTNDGHFPRIESAVDSLGHKAERGPSNTFYADTGRVLRPGQQVSFNLEVSDPNGDDVVLSVITPGRRKADVAISADGVVTWNVREEDISDPARVHFYLESQRNYHRDHTGDDGVSFIYRVLPRA